MNANIRYEQYLKTDYWKAVALEVKKRAGFRCQVCNSQLDLVAHHRCYDHRGNELQHLDDLTCLCSRCHSVFHGKTDGEEQPMEQHWNRKKRRKHKHIPPPQNQVPPVIGAPKPRTIPHTQEDIDRDMPPGDGPIILTRELIDRLRTNGAFTNAAIIPLGMTWRTMVKGWSSALVGKEVSRETYAKCLAGRYEYKAKLPSV